MNVTSAVLDCEVVITRSGAKAIRDRITGQLMHPVVGPSVESQRLYVGPARLDARLREDGALPLVLLDVGLGAASNAIAAWKLSESLAPSSRPLEIVSFDRSTAALELALEGEHASAFGLDGAALDAARALLAKGSHETARTRWRLALGDLLPTLDAEAPLSADVVFWDPFSPRANPGLWTMRAFASLRRHVGPSATVHTYSGATATRSALALAGFAVGEGIALDDGRTTTEAATHHSALTRPLDARWLDRLSRSTAPFPSDAPPDALARISRSVQFEG